MSGSLQLAPCNGLPSWSSHTGVIEGSPVGRASFVVLTFGSPVVDPYRQDIPHLLWRVLAFLGTSAVGMSSMCSMVQEASDRA